MITEALKTINHFTARNSPTILTATGVVGVVATGVLAVQAGIRVNEILNEVEYKEARELDLKEKLQATWAEYIPPVGVGGVTIAAIIMSNRIGSRRAAAMAAAYTISERAFVEYRDKARELLGDKKEQRIRDEVAQDVINRGGDVPSSLVIIEGTDVLCYDALSGRYFKGSMEMLKKAQNDLNYKMIANDYASLTDFYNLIGLESTDLSDNIGWNIDEPLELEFSSVVSPDQKPALSFSFRGQPFRGFFSRK